MKKQLINPVKLIVEKLANIQADPMKVCYGFAFGIFMSTTPLIGIKWLVALPIVWLTKWNKIACLIGIFQINYLTGPLFYALAFLIGKNVCGFTTSFGLPEKMNFQLLSDLFFDNIQLLVSLSVGGVILGIPLSLLAFYLSKSLFTKKQLCSSSEKLVVST